MGFIKVVKNSAYHKRFEVKLRRRREGKTDYQARRTLTYQPKNKYNTPKYRFVVRFTNKKVICQFIYPTLTGDRVMCEAQSRELPRYGLEAGLTNYSAAYATGLLAARRLLRQLGMDEYYQGVSAPDGKPFDVYKDFEKRATGGEEIPKRPFKAYLDIGLVMSTTGNRVFGALKGACDGGVHVPHSVKRFPGATNTSGKKRYNPELHRQRIYGLHVENYMKLLREEDGAKFEKQFRKWEGFLRGRSIEDLYKAVFAAIRKDPTFRRNERQHQPVRNRDGVLVKTHTGTYLRPNKLTLAERKERVRQKIANAMQQA